jgi:hypothetical protein
LKKNKKFRQEQIFGTSKNVFKTSNFKKKKFLFIYIK